MDHSIVVVDDDPGTIYLVGRILHGVSDLSFAGSGEKALQPNRKGQLLRALGPARGFRIDRALGGILVGGNGYRFERNRL
jgi:CheY-like chemotaxis protein